MAEKRCKNKDKESKRACDRKNRMLVHEPAYVQIANRVKIHHHGDKNHPEKTEFSPKNGHIATISQMMVENDHGGCHEQSSCRGRQPFEKSGYGIFVQGKIDQAGNPHDCI